MNYQFIERKTSNMSKEQKNEKSAIRSRAGQSNYEADPDLLNDIAIDLPPDVQCSGKSRNTMAAMSGKSARNVKTGEQTTQIVRSRGRPMKPFETEPFLSIDNLPPEKTFVSERTTLTAGAATRPSTNRAPVRQKSSAFTTYQRVFASPAARASPEPPGSTDSRRGGREPPANTPYMSPTKQMKLPNHHVKLPFKHAVVHSELIPEDRLEPSQDLKERTTFALYQINRAMTMNGEMEPTKPQGKLQKGRLKPLYPVNVEGPGISLCRGIVSDTKSYEPSPSRTLQRRLHLMSTIPNVQDYLYDHRPRTVESVHQTSAASSFSFLGDDDIDSRSLPDEVLYTTPKESAKEPRSGITDDIKDPVASQHESADVTPRMYATEPSSSDTNVTKTDLTVCDHFQQELYISDSKNANVQRSNDGTRLYITYNDDNYRDHERDESSNTQKDGAVSPSKSVRFVDEDRSESQLKEEKEIVNSRIASQQNERVSSTSKDSANNVEITIKEREAENENEKGSKKKKPSTKTCKTDEIIFRKDEDDGDDDNKRNVKRKGSLNDNRNTGTGSGNSGRNKGNDSNKSTAGNKNSDNKGQRQSRSQVQHRSRLASVTRSRSRTRNPGAGPTIRSQTPTRISRPQTPTTNSPCLKFLQSSASKPRANSLQVQTVIHGNSVSNILCPESPSRRNSHFQSPERRNSTCGTTGLKSERDVCLTATYDNTSDLKEKSKVRFMPEEDSLVVETIFLEDGDHIDIDRDKPLTFEAIEMELENLRTSIQNKLFNGTEETSVTVAESDDIDEQLSFTSADTVGGKHEDIVQANSQPDLSIECRSLMKKPDDVDTVRDGYSDLLEVYRRRCMDRSESCGILSAMLTTRNLSSVANSVRKTPGGLKPDEQNNTNNSAIRRDSDTIDKVKSEYKTPILFSSQTSDSGHGGSMYNLSEMSRSASVTMSEVPPLDLDDTTSDLGWEEGEADRQNLLDIVCDELSLQESQKEPPTLTKKEMLRQKMQLHKIQREVDVAKLKVVATTKSLSKSKQEKLTMSKGSKAAFPPLCFTINARPPTGYLYYFAYGPDMNPNRFSSYIQREITNRYWALLFGFSLVFNKKGTSVEAGGFANLEFNPLRSAEGVMYKITPQELEILDKCIGYPQHYEHLVLPVWMANSVDPDNYGVAQYCVPALTYIAQNDWTETERPLPCDYSLSQCIKGADMLTTEYRQSLETMATARQTVPA